MSSVVISNATIVTIDAAERIIPNGAIRIEHGIITQVGPLESVDLVADHLIDAGEAIALPGLFNCHAHLTMSLLRGVADGQNLEDFLGTVLPIEGALLDPDFVRTGTDLALAECVRSGISSVLDMYFFPEEILAAAAEAGIRMHTGPVFIQFPGADARPWPERMAWARSWFVSPPPSGGSTRWAQPHSTYLVTEPQLRELAELSNDAGVRVHVHAAETAAEVKQVAELHGGRTPIQVLHDVGLLHERTLLAHAVHLTDADIELIAAAKAHVVHNPASNAKLASGLCRVRDLLDAGVNVCLGTDGAASANDIDLWMAIRLAGFLPSMVKGNPSELSARELIRMATINGAKALGVADTLGSIEVGKRADIILLDPDSPYLTPTFDPYGTLAYATTRGDVDSVMIDGVMRVRGGKLGHVPDGLGARVAAAADRVAALRQSSPTQ
jgi:5-methylthioadenosine/S-adenosylhomocysteine deaminase